MFDAAVAFAVSLACFGGGVWVVSILVKPWQGAALRFLHRVVFLWHREHVYFLPTGRPDPDLACAICNRRMRYIPGVDVA